MEFSKITKNFEKDLIFEKDFEKDKIFKLKIWFDSLAKTLIFKKFLKKSIQIFEFDERKRERYFFDFWIFYDEREKHEKDSMHENFGSKQMMHARTLWMSRWTPRTLWRSWWTSRTYFWKIFYAKKTCKTPNLEIFDA